MEYLKRSVAGIFLNRLFSLSETLFTDIEDSRKSREIYEEIGDISEVRKSNLQSEKHYKNGIRLMKTIAIIARKFS